MKIINVTEFGIDIQMYDELLAIFENACEDLYYGEGRSQFIEFHKDYASEDDLGKIWTAAWWFMAEERQPDIAPLANIKLLS